MRKNSFTVRLFSLEKLRCSDIAVFCSNALQGWRTQHKQRPCNETAMQRNRKTRNCYSLKEQLFSWYIVLIKARKRHAINSETALHFLELFAIKWLIVIHFYHFCSSIFLIKSWIYLVSFPDSRKLSLFCPDESLIKYVWLNVFHCCRFNYQALPNTA